MARRLSGIAASSGVAIGPSMVVLGRRGKVTRARIKLGQVELEIDRFERARAATRMHLNTIREQVASGVGGEYTGIMDSHLLVLDDPLVVSDTIARVRERLEVVEYAYAKVTQKIIRSFESFADPFFRERSTDVLDVRERVLHHLMGLTHPDLAEIDEPVIVIAERLTPSTTLSLPRDKVLGFATARGGKGAHAALLARSMEIPAVVGVRGLIDEVDAGMTLAIDGHAGIVVVDPDESQLAEFEDRRSRFLAFVHGLESLRDEEARTEDGHGVQLLANIEYPEEVEAVASHGARGIGLYRTEYLLLKPGPTEIRDEEAQYRSYMAVAQAMYPDPVVIRTFDLGGDKLLDEGWEPEDNPFLGFRAIRLCLGHRSIFRTQLRALLRASKLGNVRILFPMISGVDEVREAKRFLEGVKDELHRERAEFRADTPIGIMIEIPSAAICADLLAKEVDFFSVGTNDLTQYTLAVDRNNERVDYLYEPLHPAVLRLLRLVISSARQERCSIGICGELAGDPMATALLLGLGFDTLSTSLMSLPEIKKIIRSVTMPEAREVATEALTLASAAEVREYLHSYSTLRYPWLKI